MPPGHIGYFELKTIKAQKIQGDTPPKCLKEFRGPAPGREPEITTVLYELGMIDREELSKVCLLKFLSMPHCF